MDFYLEQPGFQVLLGWFSTVDMTKLQEVAVNPMVQILISLVEALPDQFQWDVRSISLQKNEF